MQKKYLSRALLLAAVPALFLMNGCKKTITKPTSSGDVLSTADAQAPQFFKKQTEEKYVAGEVLVKFRAGTSEEVKGNIFKRVGGSIAERILTQAMQQAGDKEGFYRISISSQIIQAISMLKGMNEIEVAEPNYIYVYGAVSNDPYFTGGSLWGMYGAATTPANAYGSQAATAWAAGHTGLSTVVVGIIDEGVMNTHEDLAANCWVNTYDPVNGVDDDGNGYVDDTWGWDFVGNDRNTFDGTNDDHATHVAGTIGAVGGNAKGVAGVNWNVKMISCKFLGNSGGTTANAIKACDYITDMKTRHGMNIVAINNSWGGGGYSALLYAAIDRANTANILFVAAAGNETSNNDATASYPSNYTNNNVIAVAAIKSTGALSSFSNWGATSVDLGAPGEAIYSTIPGKGTAHTIISSYASYSGTSMATPHVTGAVALYASTHPGSTAAAIKSAILTSTIPTPSLSGKCVTGGRLNVSGY